MSVDVFQYHQSPEETPSTEEACMNRGKDIARQSGNLFIKFSDAYPAQEANIAAAIAITLREEQLPFTAQEARTELLEKEYNSEEIKRITDLTNNAHKRKGILEKVGIKTEGEIRDMLLIVFGFARELNVLETDEIKTIFTFGNDLPANTSKREREKIRVQFATRLYINKQLQLNAAKMHSSPK